ncbi:hypothetical protein B0T19DRAFT_223096 [Cercophora scortea]|uniref:Uncharacterized protein n=1 Tax=Cercophora scortea TaxID=314031 RepID=A0AAE0IFD0_9PEZI|nr:hypothetical protein B0T19DRAFT_223096 [Cercophora scortea]
MMDDPSAGKPLELRKAWHIANLHVAPGRWREFVRPRFFRQGGEVAWAVPVGQARDAEAEAEMQRDAEPDLTRGVIRGVRLYRFWRRGPWTVAVPTQQPTARPGAMHRWQPPSRRHGPCHTSLMHRRYCSCLQRGLHALVLALAHELPADQVPRSKTTCRGTLAHWEVVRAGQGMARQALSASELSFPGLWLSILLHPWIIALHHVLEVP